MDWTTALQTALPYLPAKYAGDAMALVSFLIAASALALRFWKPPASTSKWLPVYKIVVEIAQAKGWNANAFQPDAKAMMLPLTASRTIEAPKLGLDPASTHPNAGEPPKPLA